MSDVPLFTGTRDEVAAKRLAIVVEALSWVGTPFHDRAGVKGSGCDCVHLLQRVFQRCGFALDLSMPEYPPQWFQHQDEPKFLMGLARYARKVERPEAGDVAMFNYGRHAAHGAIIVATNRIVHASNIVGHVSVDNLRPYLERLDSFWSVFA